MSSGRAENLHWDLPRSCDRCKIWLWIMLGKHGNLQMDYRGEQSVLRTSYLRFVWLSLADWPLTKVSGLNLVRRVQLSESRAADSRAAGATVPAIAARVLLSWVRNAQSLCSVNSPNYSLWVAIVLQISGADCSPAVWGISWYLHLSPLRL